MPRLGLVAVGALAAGVLAACQSPTRVAGDGAALYGRWEKIEKSMPPITLELRRSAAGPEGQVWLSGVTYTLPATVNDTVVVLADPASSRPAPFVAVLRKDGALHVRLDGHDREERLVRRNLND